MILSQVHWLWRAVDQDGYVLDEILQRRRPRRGLTRLLKKQGARPKRIITDKLKSYGAARRQLMACVEHRSHKGLKNRAENSHLPLRKRERVMQKFRLPSGCQRFVVVFLRYQQSLRPTRLHCHRSFPPYPSYQRFRPMEQRDGSP